MSPMTSTPPSSVCLGSAAATVFTDTGCASCHNNAYMPGPNFKAYLYSDLLLHDMGPDLADGLAQGAATGSEFRTMTLVRLSERTHFLHDGRAHTPTEAILAHGGQGSASTTAFRALGQGDRDALLAFLGCL